MQSALIIGASRGIGHEFACQLLAAGWRVFATARHEQDLDELRAIGASALKLDVASTDSISTLAWQLDGVELDLAVYVAGVYGSDQGAHHAPSRKEFDHVMHTNVLGAMQLIPTVAPMVEAAQGKFAFISSGMASIADASASNGWVYRASKTALNMVVKTAAFDYPKAICIALSPGWVQTELGGPNAPLSVEQSVSGMLNVIGSLTVQDSGTFRRYTGERLAW